MILRNWEQRRRESEIPARILLAVLACAGDSLAIGPLVLGFLAASLSGSLKRHSLAALPPYKRKNSLKT
jgi:hypothetical protein